MTSARHDPGEARRRRRASRSRGSTPMPMSATAVDENTCATVLPGFTRVHSQDDCR